MRSLFSTSRIPIAIPITALALALLLSACGGGEAELRPELEAHLAEYESLIDEYTDRFEDAAGNMSEFMGVAEDYSTDVLSWMSEWERVAPNMTEEEGRAVQKRIEALNQRAERMMTSG